MSAAGRPPKPIGGGSAARSKAATAQSKGLVKARSARIKQLQDALQIGPKPEEPSSVFMQHNKDLFNIPIDHMISMKPLGSDQCPSLDKKVIDQATATRDNKVRSYFFINAGKPFKGRPDIGKGFHGWPWTKKDDSDTYEPTDWEFELDKKKCHGTCWTDPDNPTMVPTVSNGDFVVNPLPTYTKADYLARCMGHKALCTASTEAFKMFVLGVEHDYKTGKSLQVGKIEDEDAWNRQRDALFKSLSKIYMVYPVPVHPAVDRNGMAFAKDPDVNDSGDLYDNTAERLAISHTTEELDESGNPKVIKDVMGTEYEYIYAPQPVIFCSITPDTTSAEAEELRAERPDADKRNIVGWHDTTRAWPLLPSHVVAIQKLLVDYELEESFPALAKLHKARCGAMLNLDYLRSLNLSKIGHPPGEDHEPLDEEWLNVLSDMPFGKVWVHKCTPECPDGVNEFASDKPKLVPLLKGRAQEKNGVPWINAVKLEDDKSPEGARHYVGVMKALHRILGKEWDKSGTKRKAALGFTVMSAQRDEKLRQEEEVGGDGNKRRRKMSKSKDVDEVLAVAGASQSTALATRAEDAEDAANGDSVVLKELEASISANKHVFHRNTDRGRLTFSNDCDISACRVVWPDTRGALTITIGKRGQEDYKKIDVNPGTPVTLLYEAHWHPDSDSDQ